MTRVVMFLVTPCEELGSQLPPNSDHHRQQKSPAHQKLRASDIPARLMTLARPTLVFLALVAIPTAGAARARHPFGPPSSAVGSGAMGAMGGGATGRGAMGAKTGAMGATTGA